MDRFYEQLRKRIEENGHTFIYVGPGEKGPAFTYTIGLSETYGWPELILTGNLRPDLAQQLLNGVIRKWKDDKSCSTGTYPNFIDLTDGRSAAIKLVLLARAPVQENYTIQVGQVLRHNRYDVIQVYWPDNKNNLPDTPVYSSDLKMEQPMLPRLS